MLQEKRGFSKIVLIIACVMLLQCLTLLYWQTQRGNYFIDDLHSFEAAGAYLSDSRPYYTEDPMWEYGKWMKTSDLIGHLKVDGDETILTLPLGRRLMLLAQKRTYNGLLNLIMSDAGYETPIFQYSREVLMLNMMFFLIAELLLAYLLKELTGNREIMILGSIMFGFSGIIMCLCEYVRFYILVIALFLIFLCCHLMIWREYRIKRILMWELLSLIAAYFGLLHSELILVTCGSFFCIFMIGLLCRKRFRHAAVYSAPLLGGMYIYVYQKTNLLDIVLHPADYAVYGGHGAALATYNMLTCTPQRFWECFRDICNVFGEKWFGRNWIMWALLSLLVICKIYSLKNKKAGSSVKDSDHNAGFILILGITALISLLFNLLTSLRTERYNSLIIVLFMIVFWFCVDRMRDVFDRKKYISIVAILVIIGAVVSQRPDSFTYLFVNEQPLKNLSIDYMDTDCVMFTGGNINAPYDCIIHAGTNSRVLAVEPGRESKFHKIKKLPDKLLAFSANSTETELMRQAMDKADYEMSFVGQTWQNEIYLCVKK